MLTITVGAAEVFDESTGEFSTHGGVELQLEHSLVSLSKWESKHEKPFLGELSKTPEETLDYIRCMVLGPIPPGDFLHKLSKENYEAINEYLGRKMTATWFYEAPGAPKTRREVVTAELIYYWMTVFHIDFECQYWHLNRLFTLIRICNLKQETPKKMSRAQISARNKALNDQRKAQLGTKG